MFIWNCDRRSFAEWFVKGQHLTKSQVREVKSIERLTFSNGEIALIWESTPIEEFSLPRAILVQDAEVQDFLAWTATYLRNIRPITSQMRILGRSSVNFPNSFSSSNFSKRARAIDIGLVLAEAVILSGGRIETSKMPFLAYARTLSYVFAQAVRRYSIYSNNHAELFEKIENAWVETRRLTKQSSIKLNTTRLRDIWKVIMLLQDFRSGTRSTEMTDVVLLDAMDELYRHGTLSEACWLRVSAGMAESNKLWEQLIGPRESRVVAVENFLSSLTSKRQHEMPYSAFVCGYIVSQINPGTLDHIRVLLPYLETVPESLLWYGVCAGTVEGTEIENHAQGLGWLMRRELGRPASWMDRPRCDIALNEMSTLLSDPESRRPPFRTLVPGILEVEIFPLVSTTVTWNEEASTGRDAEQGQLKQRELFEVESQDIRKDIDDWMRQLSDCERTIIGLKSRIEKRFGKKPKTSR